MSEEIRVPLRLLFSVCNRSYSMLACHKMLQIAAFWHCCQNASNLYNLKLLKDIMLCGLCINSNLLSNSINYNSKAHQAPLCPFGLTGNAKKLLIHYTMHCQMKSFIKVT